MVQISSKVQHYTTYTRQNNTQNTQNDRCCEAEYTTQTKPNSAKLNKNPIVNIPNMYALSLSLRFIFPLLSFFFRKKNCLTTLNKVLL